VKVLSLFSGIGGLDLGLERAGMTVVGQSEVDAYASRVLAKHWPTVPNLGDITKITEDDLERIGPIDLVCGGFPCQDLSVAGKQGGIKASRSGLFFDLMRVVRLVRPRLVLLENVPALLARADWMGAVLGALAESGFDAEWDCIPAQAVGAHHRRDRVFIVAHTAGKGRKRPSGAGLQGDILRPSGGREDVAYTQDRLGLRVADDGLGRANSERQGLQGPSGGGGRHGWRRPSGDWPPESPVGRVADGVPARVDRLRGLGNAVVPQVAEHVGRIIMEVFDAA
tara:strand:- start:1614 stop:2459 length:846 start_codon:yes stop_codon:yes gene_type:complete